MAPSLPRNVLILFLCLAGSRLLLPDAAPPERGEHRCCLSPEQEAVLAHFSLTYLDNGQGQRARTVRFSGANLQIVNGLGATNGHPADPDSLNPLVTRTNGVGNLIVGYNEARDGSLRTGSHNVVVGQGHTFKRFGGVVTGRNNTITGPFASVSGGHYNRATESQSSVSGGRYNLASGEYASVSGGEVNHASGWSGSVTGGKGNEASSGFLYPSSVTGGRLNEASGPYSTVSGGFQRTADDFDEWVAGGLSYP